MSEIEGEQLIKAALSTQLLYVHHNGIVRQANRAIREMVYGLQLQRENPLDHQASIAQSYIQAIKEADESVGSDLENNLEVLAQVVGRTCLLSFFNDTDHQHLAEYGRNPYKSYCMQVTRSGLEPSVAVHLTFGFALTPYIEAAADHDNDLHEIPGIRFDSAVEVGRQIVSLPWHVVDWIEVE